MAGFGLLGFAERIPCPHCKSTDCSGIADDKIICCTTRLEVSTSQLLESAIERLLERAELAFWNEVRSMVSVKSGDIPYDVAIDLKESMCQAVTAWLKVNQPALSRRDIEEDSGA